MKKKILIMIIVAQMLILHTCGLAYAATYDKSVRYRYNMWGSYDGQAYQTSWIDYISANSFSWSDAHTDNMTFYNADNYTTLAETQTFVTTTQGDDGSLKFKSRHVSGALTDPTLNSFECTYYYRYAQGSSVDVDYTVSVTVDDPAGNYSTLRTKICGISRSDGSLRDLQSVYWSRTPTADQMLYGQTYTLTGSDGYNYSGFAVVLWLEAYSGSTRFIDMSSNTEYVLYKITTNLDTSTDVPNYEEQLTGIAGLLDSIKSSISGGFTTITNAITNIGSSILNGIEHLFVYDDWQEDLESITSEVDIPYIEDLTAAFSDITSIFNTYSPDDDIEVKIKNPIYTLHGGREYMVNTTYSLDTPLSVGIGGYTIKQLFHIISGMFVLAYFVKIVTKLMAVFGIRFNEFILPWIKEVIHR